MAFITPMGIVSLFSDMTHEGARSILGEYLNLTGASAATIGFVSGIGELCGYSLRLLSGFVADKAKRYWSLVIIGYAMQVLTIPGLALIPENGWVAACGLVIPRSMRSTGFGIFETGFGIAWFLGSWLLGALYDISPRMAGSRFGGGAAVGYRLLYPVHPPAGEGALTAERRKALFAAAPAPHTKKHFPTSRFRRC